MLLMSRDALVAYMYLSLVPRLWGVWERDCMYLHIYRIATCIHVYAGTCLLQAFRSSF